MVKVMLHPSVYRMTTSKYFHNQRAHLVGFELHVPMLWFKGETTLRPSKIVVTKTKKLHLVFLGTCGDHILDYFVHFK